MVGEPSTTEHPFTVQGVRGIGYRVPTGYKAVAYWDDYQLRAWALGPTLRQAIENLEAELVGAL